MTDKVVDLEQYKYDEAEKELRVKLVEYSEKQEYQAQIGEAFYIWKNDPYMSTEDITEDQIDDVTFEKFFDWFLYDFKLFDTQERLIEKYYKEEAANLEKLEKSVLKDWLDNLYSYFEVKDVNPGKDCTIRDILTNNEYKVFDKSSSEQIKTSDIIGARPLKSGNYTFFSGIISVYPAAFKTLIQNFFESQLKEYNKTVGTEKTKNDYLKDFGYEIGQFLEEAVKNPQYITPEGDEFTLAEAVYELNDMDKVLKKIGRIKSIIELSGDQDEIKVFSWEKTGKDSVTGTIEIDSGELKVSCYSAQMLSQARGRIEKELGALVKHKEDRFKELSSLIDSKRGDSPAPKKYPLGIKNRKELDSSLDSHYEEWINKPLSALNNMTPSESLQTKEGREKLSLILIDLEKLYDQAKKRGEPYYDVSKLRKRLNIT